MKLKKISKSWYRVGVTDWYIVRYPGNDLWDIGKDDNENKTLTLQQQCFGTKKEAVEYFENNILIKRQNA